MKHSLFTLLLILGSLSTLNAQPTLTSFFGETNTFLQAHVDNGRVDYATIKKDPAALSALIKQVGTISLATASPVEKKAFYINAYNLLVIQQVVSLFPLKSPLDAPGFFDKRKQRVAGEEITLNELEKDRLLKTYADARIHFAVVCAAKSCPVLSESAYVPQRLDAQLDERAKLALNSSYFIRVNAKQNRVEVSKLFEWYQADFTRNGQSVLAYVNSFRQEKIPATYAVGSYEYDWSLNGK